MKKSILASPACFAIVLSLGGCFGGKDGDDNPADPGGSAKTSNTRKLSPGLYVGDYTPYDSRNILESEFTIGEDGSYRFFWFYLNDPVVDVGGSWFQKDSNLHFSGVHESYVEGGLFYPGMAVDDDTNAIRQISETSFVREEWTPLRQKPFWITYRKKSINTLGDGTFRYTGEHVLDDTTSNSVRIDISLEGTGFAYDFVESYSGDTLDAFQAQATWYQIGSVFATEQNLGRRYDTSAHAYTTYWDSIPGTLMQRIGDVSDTAFHLWSPASFFTEGRWDEYRKE